MGQPNTREGLYQRGLAAILGKAFFDWKSAIVIALTLLLAAFLSDDLGVSGAGLPGWHWWYFALGGLASWGALLASMLTDPAFRARVVADMLSQKFDIGRLRNKESRSRIAKALEYRQRITEAAGRAREGLVRDHLQETARQIDEWINNMYTLAIRLDAYEGDDVIHQDLHSVPRALENLKLRLKEEDDATVRTQIERTIEAKAKQWDSLKSLSNMMEKAELQMDSTITALGTVYSQQLLLGVKDIDSGRAQRLREDISEQVGQLHDLVDSVDEVYARRA